ncbi:hypothetical protein Tco_0367957 [Tanacetum coccineum]
MLNQIPPYEGILDRNNETRSRLIFGVIFSLLVSLRSSTYGYYLASCALGAFETRGYQQNFKDLKVEPDTSPKQNLVQATKGTILKSKAKVTKPDKKKQPAKKPKAKGLAVLSEVMELALSQSEDEDEDDENNYDDLSDEGDDNNDGDDDDSNDDDKQEGDDTNDDDEETDSDRTESDKIKIPVLDQYTTEYYKEEEKIDNEETMDEEEDDEVTKELYDDVNVNLENEDTKITNADQGASEQQNVSQDSGFEQVEEDTHVILTPVLETQKSGGPTQSSSVSSDFTSKLLNLDNPSPADNEIASLMDTIAQHATTIPKIASSFTATNPLLPQFFNPLLQQATPTLTPITSKATTLFPSLLDFSSVFRFNDRVTNFEKDLSEIKQVDQYAQALSSIPTIVDRYMYNKLGEVINKAILAHNLDCRQEAQDENNAYIELVDTSMRALIKEEVNAQLPQILPQAILDFANPVIEKNVTESIEATVLKMSSSQPMSTYELYDALFESYNTDKDLFDSYGEVFSLKRTRDEKVKDQDPSTRSDRGTKRRKSSKDAESSRDSRSKEKKSSRTSKDASQSQHKSSGKSAHAEEPSHTVKDSSMQQDQEFATGNNDEQPTDKEVTKADWFKKPERPPTPDPYWSKRQQVNFQPSQTWISQVARAEEPPTSFDEFNDTSFDFSAFIMNRLKILNLNHEILSKYDQHAYLVTSLWGPKRQRFYGYASYLTSSKDVYSRRRIIAVTRLKIMKMYDYGHLEEIEVRQDDQKLYTFKERYFKRLRLQDIEDMLLLLVQQKLTNLTIDERSNLKNKTTYTSYSDPHGIIYVDRYKRKKLMRTDELHKFSDGTLNDVWSILYDIDARIRMEYLPMRK